MVVQRADLITLERERPALSLLYDCSSFAYSATGASLLYNSSRLPLGKHAILGRPFASMMVAQGGLSYLNDVHTMKGRGLLGHKPAIVWADRLLALSNFACVLGCARLWPRAIGAPSPLLNVVVASCCVTFTGSKACETTGDAEGYTRWHTAWHCVPNFLGLVWLRSALRRPPPR